MSESIRCAGIGGLCVVLYFFSNEQHEESLLAISGMVMFAASAICRAIEKQ